MEQYYQISALTEGFFKDRGSRFFSFAFPVLNPAQMDDQLRHLKKQYHDGRHHCSAYRIGLKGETVYANDDGEPSHSAGAPILAAIRSFSLTNTGIVVVRYFGGTKLGVRGLIEAYRTAAEDAILQGQRVAIIPKVHFQLTYPYEQTSAINRILHPFETKMIGAEYTSVCRQQFSIREGLYPELAAALRREQFEPEILDTPENG